VNSSCRQCGEQFATPSRYRLRRKYCSAACRQAAHRERFPSTDEEKVKAREATRRWVQKYPERFLAQRYRKYGITLADYERIALEQNGLCALCGQAETGLQLGRPIRLAVDHDHTTGRVRGLLCRRCNMALKHDLTPDLLRKMADYIERSMGK
jgi:hypothetical protein